MSLLPVDEAIARVLAGVEPTGAETVPLADATGRVLAAPLAARRTHPPFPASAMDGYALRAEDAAHPGAILRVVGMAAAGHGFRRSFAPGECVRIFTGAPVPPPADAILIQENAEALDAETIRVSETVTAGRHIRRAGLDFAEGDTLLLAGRQLGMAEAALAAAMGHPLLPVRRRPLVAVIATGDELVPPSETPGPDQIVASNSFGIAALCRAEGAEPCDLGIVRDHRMAIGDAVERALALPADVIVTLGGASVGEHDLVRQTLEVRGMALDFWRIAMRPGKPLMFGRFGATRVLGLPGNPVSSLVCAVLFLKPLIASLLGREPGDPTVAAIAGADLPANDHRQDYLRATLRRSRDGEAVASPLPLQDSSVLSSLAAADCLLVRPPHAPPMPAGAPCRVVPLRGPA